MKVLCEINSYILILYIHSKYKKDIDSQNLKSLLHVTQNDIREARSSRLFLYLGHGTSCAAAFAGGATLEASFSLSILGDRL